MRDLCNMFEELEEIHKRPDPFSVYTAEALWADEHRSRQMLKYHLNGAIDLSSRSTQFLDRSSAWIKNRFDLGPEKSVCDFGCGPGLYTSRFAQSGAQVTGVDFSFNSIEYAREEARRAGHKINYVHRGYLDYNSDNRFDLVTMIMCDYCALSPAQRQQLLTTWRACLNDDGAILFDVYSMAAYADRVEASVIEKNQLDHFWHAEEYYAFVGTFKYDSDAVVLDKYSIYPEHSRAETVYNWLQYFSPERLAEELAKAGFQIAQLCGNVAGGEYDEQSYEFAVVVTKER